MKIAIGYKYSETRGGGGLKSKETCSSEAEKTSKQYVIHGYLVKNLAELGLIFV